MAHGTHAPVRRVAGNGRSSSIIPSSQISSRGWRTGKSCTARPRAAPSNPKWRPGSAPKLNVSAPSPYGSRPLIKKSKLTLNSSGGGARFSLGVISRALPTELYAPFVRRSTPSAVGQSHSHCVEVAVV
eukprot:1335509-Prymnesium_polylepis.1